MIATEAEVRSNVTAISCHGAPVKPAPAIGVERLVPHIAASSNANQMSISGWTNTDSVCVFVRLPCIFPMSTELDNFG